MLQPVIQKRAERHGADDKPIAAATEVVDKIKETTAPSGPLHPKHRRRGGMAGWHRRKETPSSSLRRSHVPSVHLPLPSLSTGIDVSSSMVCIIGMIRREEERDATPRE
jgi:hypothetical protein